MATACSSRQAPWSFAPLSHKRLKHSEAPRLCSSPRPSQSRTSQIGGGCPTPRSVPESRRCQRPGAWGRTPGAPRCRAGVRRGGLSVGVCLPRAAQTRGARRCKRSARSPGGSDMRGCDRRPRRKEARRHCLEWMSAPSRQVSTRALEQLQPQEPQHERALEQGHCS